MRLKKVKETATFRESENVLLAKSLRKFERLNNVSARAGIIEGHSKNYPDGTDIVMVATANEKGTSKIPSRPWLRIGFDRNRKYLEAQMRALADNVLLGKTDVGTGMALVGQQLLATQRQSLQQLQAPALSPRTVQKKLADRASGRKPKPPSQYFSAADKPLIETSHLIQNHVFLVEGV